MSADHLYPVDDELGLLGCCLMGGIDTAIDAVASVPVDAIFTDDVRESYAILEHLTTLGDRCDEPRMRKEWERRNGSRPVPVEVWDKARNSTPGPINLPYHVTGVMEAYRRRRVREMSMRLTQRSEDASVALDTLMSEAEEVLDGQESDVPRVLDGRECAHEFIDDLEERSKRPTDALSGVASGFYRLDRLTDGFQFGEQAVIGARPSVGKTALAVAILETACIRGGVPTLFLTLEMSPMALMRRLASVYCGIGLRKIKKAEFTPSETNRMMAFNAACAKAPLQIVDGVSGMSVSTACSMIRRAVRAKGVKLVLVDYLQKLQPSSRHEKRTYEVADVSSRLKGIAAKTGVAMVTLAQLNRESEKEKRRPALRDLADSSQIERDADLVALLHREKSGDDANQAELIIAKQRDGELGIVNLNFEGSCLKFSNQSEGN